MNKKKLIALMTNINIVHMYELKRRLVGKNINKKRLLSQKRQLITEKIKLS